MAEKVCERCGASPEGAFGLLDYCAECSRDLCDACMAKGCCGHVPALSGSAWEDDADEDGGQPDEAQEWADFDPEC